MTSFLKVTPVTTNFRPGFLGDFANREHILPGGAKLDASTFYGAEAIKVVAGTTSADATSITVGALTGPIPVGAILDFGTNKFARLTAAAATGATTLTVAAIPKALVSGDTARYLAPDQTRRVAAGTPVYVEAAELVSDDAARGNAPVLWKNAGDGIVVTSTSVVRLIAYDVPDVVDNNDVDLVRKGTLVRANHMYWSTLGTVVQGKIQVDYEVTLGTPGQEVSSA